MRQCLFLFAFKTRETIVYGVTLGVEFGLTLEASLDFTFSKSGSILIFKVCEMVN